MSPCLECSLWLGPLPSSLSCCTSILCIKSFNCIRHQSMCLTGLHLGPISCVPVNLFALAVLKTMDFKLLRFLWLREQIHQSHLLMLLCGLGENTGVTKLVSRARAYHQGREKQHICCGSQCCQADRPYGLFPLSTSHISAPLIWQEWHLRRGCELCFNEHCTLLNSLCVDSPCCYISCSLLLHCFSHSSLHAYEWVHVCVFNLKITTHTTQLMPCLFFCCL